MVGSAVGILCRNCRNYHLGYNAQKDEYLLLKDSVVNDEEIESNKEYANKLLEISDSIIVYDLKAGKKNEKEK